MTTTTSTPAASTAGESTPKMLSGIGVGRGSAVGSVVKLAPAARPPIDEPAAADIPKAEDLVRSSFQFVATNLRVRAAATAAVLEATSLMAQDPGLLADVERRIKAGTGPATAVDQAVEGFCKILEASGPYL